MEQRACNTEPRKAEHEYHTQKLVPESYGFNIEHGFHTVAWANAGANYQQAPESLRQHIKVLARQLEKQLDSTEMGALFTFLTTHSETSSVPYGNKEYSQQYHQKWDAFKATESNYSNKDNRELTSPDGPLDAKIGVVLHVLHIKPPADGTPRPKVGLFWDPASRSIDPLIQKGFSSQETFGMDWHHRVIDGTMGCPREQNIWSKALVAHHDQISRDILNLIPCPFLVIGGTCAWNSYLAGITYKKISLEVEGGVELTYVLEFESSNRQVLRRITAKIDHPSYMYQFSASKDVPLRLDTQCDLIRYLAGKSFNTGSAVLAMQNFLPVMRGKAPIGPLWNQKAIERESGKSLSASELHPGLLSYIHHSLGVEEAQRISDAGDSLLDACSKPMRDKISVAHTQMSEAKAYELGQSLIAGMRKSVPVKSQGTRFQLSTRLHWSLVSVPYDKQDQRAIKELKTLEVEFKAEFVDVNIHTKPTLASTLAKSEDPCYGLRIQTKYEIQRGQQLVTVTSYLKPTPCPRRLCHMNSITDLVKGKPYSFTRSQPHRLIPPSRVRLSKKVISSAYSSCETPGCTTCAKFKKSGC